MLPHELKRKVKGLEDLGLSQRKIAKFSDISPSALTRFLNGERSGMNIAAKVSSFITGTDKLGKFKVNGVSGEIIAIKEHSIKGKTKIYQPNDLSYKEKQLYEEIILETDKVIKSSKNIEEISIKYRNLLKKLTIKHKNEIQIPFWIARRLFEIYHTSFPFCTTTKQETIIFQTIKDILENLLTKINPKEKSWKEIDYRIRAMNLNGIVLKCEEKSEEASNSYFKGMQLGIGWFGIQVETNKVSSYPICQSLLEIALNSLNNALYSYKSRLIAESKNLFLLLDRDFDKPGNLIGKSVIEKVVEVMREYKENKLSVSTESVPFSYFFREYVEFKEQIVEKFNLKKEVALV